MRAPTLPQNRQAQAARVREAKGGLLLLLGIVAFMWFVEVINTLDSNHLDRDGLYARSIHHLWGILTSPFIHASFQHLTDNTVPFVFLGVIIALRGARRLALVTALIVVLSGIGTWLISPGGVSTIGCSGVVFGYATYLLTRGFFDRSLLEILVGAIVGVVWGAVLIASLVPHTGVSWQDHLCGAIAGVLVAWRLAEQDRRHRPGATGGASSGAAVARSGPAALAR